MTKPNQHSVRILKQLKIVSALTAAFLLLHITDCSSLVMVNLFSVSKLWPWSVWNTYRTANTMKLWYGFLIILINCLAGSWHLYEISITIEQSVVFVSMLFVFLCFVFMLVIFVLLVLNVIDFVNDVATETSKWRLKMCFTNYLFCYLIIYLMTTLPLALWSCCKSILSVKKYHYCSFSLQDFIARPLMQMKCKLTGKGSCICVLYVVIIVAYLADDAWLSVHWSRTWRSSMQQESLFCIECKYSQILSIKHIIK